MRLSDFFTLICIKLLVMKKFWEWIFTIVVSVAYCILLHLQYKNFQSTHKIYEEQYERNVYNAISQFTQELVNEEALMYINNAFQELKRGNQQEYENLLKKNYEIESRKDSLQLILDSDLPKKAQRDLIAKTALRFREERYLQKLQTKEIVEDVISNWFDDMRTKNIRDRVNFDNFQPLLTELLAENGINDNFVLSITDNSGKIIYGKPSPDNTLKVYSHKLFPNEILNPYFINIVIPEREELSFDVRHMFIPSIAITIMLFFSFTAITIALISRKKMDKTKNEFINNLTHELKTPISSISLAAQLMQDSSFKKSPEMLNRISDILNEETKRLSFQIEKVLQLSALEKEKALLNFKPLNVNDLIETIVKNFSFKIENYHGMLHTDLNAENPYAMIDEGHFTNVIYNLMDNAVKYSNTNRNLILKIETWNKGKWLYISVEDNGIGIKKSDLKHIFKRFYRASTGNRHDIKGFGLGLSYVKKIVTNHKGRIFAESEFEIGTKFTIAIPYIINK